MKIDGIEITTKKRINDFKIVKKSIHKDVINNKEQLKAAIKRAFQEVNQETLSSVHERSWRRIALSTVLSGKQVDAFDK